MSCDYKLHFSVQVTGLLCGKSSGGVLGLAKRHSQADSRGRKYTPLPTSMLDTVLHQD